MPSTRTAAANATHHTPKGGRDSKSPPASYQPSMTSAANPSRQLRTAIQKLMRITPLTQRVAQTSLPSVLVRPVSVRHVALQHDAIEVAHLVHVVVAVGLVQQATVVPDHEGAWVPGMAILEALLRRVRQQLGEQWQRLLVIEAEDALDADRIDV